MRASEPPEGRSEGQDPLPDRTRKGLKTRETRNSTHMGKPKLLEDWIDPSNSSADPYPWKGSFGRRSAKDSRILAANHEMHGRMQRLLFDSRRSRSKP